jgi:hypothetical protein
MKTWTVIGRITEKENVCLYVKAMTLDAAIHRFSRLVWSSTDRANKFKDTEFYIEAVFEGEQPNLAGDLAWPYSL